MPVIRLINFARSADSALVHWKPTLRAARSCCCGLIIAAALAGCANPQDKPAVLEAVLQSREQIWNALARFDGQTYLAGPRWTGTQGPQLTVVDTQGRRAAFPDAAWNAWAPGKDARQAFVNINALRLEKSVLWVVDTGAAEFAGNPIPGGAKLVAFDLVEKRVVRSYPLPAEIARPGSYIDDVRFQGGYAFLTDAGNAGIVVLDLQTGNARRVLDGHPAVSAGNDRDIVLSGQQVKAPGERHCVSMPTRWRSAWMASGCISGRFRALGPRSVFTI